MAITVKSAGDTYEMHTAVPNTYDIILRAETSSSAAPDGASPSNLGAWSYSATGGLKFTFTAGMQPKVILHADPQVEENGDLELKFVSYSSSTRIATFALYSAGTLANTNNYTISIKLTCCKTTQHGS